MANELIPLSDVEKMANAVAVSGLFGVKTKEQALALMLVAQAQGVHPATAAMQYNIIQGKPSKKTEAMLADFIHAGGSVKWGELTDKKAEATFSHPQGGTVTLDWTIERAQKAGLLAKDGSMYIKYPRAMLRSRVISEGIRTIYPAATGGMRAPEEFDEEETAMRTVDPKKSRIENIVDQNASAEDAVVVENKDVKPMSVKEADKPTATVKETAPKENAPKETKKTTKAKKDPEPVATAAPTVTGLIEDIKVQNIDVDGEAKTKFAYKIKDKYYGTFDAEIHKQAEIAFDNARLVKVEYSERKKGDKTFQDIVSFRELSENDMPATEATEL